MKIKLILIQIFSLILLNANAQNAPFSIYLEKISVEGLFGIQSYAFGQYDGKWLIVGGRLDGLHRRQPFAAFDVAGHNIQLIVVDPVSKQKWSTPLSSLSTPTQEQLSSTNMEFYQEDSILYCMGGYGYSASRNDHTTFPNITAINVPKVIEAIVKSKPITGYFNQITNQKFAVTGGRLEKINDTYYLVGGQYFEGRYNPQGPDHGPGFIQKYTNAITTFKIKTNGLNFSLDQVSTISDSINLHRRDYNVGPQIMPNGNEGITAFSGVFQATANIPYLNCVTIDSNGYKVQTNFSQYYNHYHCANFGIYSTKQNEMHTVFFGGIAQYYDSSGILVQDNDVPFVKTIARVTRDSKGNMAEYKLPVSMPDYLGAGSEFIPNQNLPIYENKVIKLDELGNDSTVVGYIYGGISSTAKNVFFTNTGTQSAASNHIYKVILIKNASAGIHQINKQSQGSLQMHVYPNPNDGKFIIKFNSSKNETVTIKITDMTGKLIKTETLSDLNPGENTISYKIRKLGYGTTFMVSIETLNEKAIQKIIIND